MNVREITKGIYYVGVNDRTTEKFEALWELPYGVSYNSYVVVGDKVAVIDTVLYDEEQDFARNLSDVLKGRKIDYLVVNHMEPDHSGSISALLLKNPGMKIVADKPAIGMVKGFYHIDDDSVFHEVKDGDELDLGGLTLQFHMTPMVHWPETMMTYVKERKVLFSGDGFGTFGALQGAVVDTDMDTSLYFREMYRYYSNIVGKYGKFVQRALAKLQGLELAYICSTHGPVWHEKIEEVVDITNRLSAYESEPGVVIVYGSMYGNTAEMADTIATELSKRGVRKITVHNASHSTMSQMITDCYRYSAIIIGSPTYSMSLFPPIDQLMKAMVVREVPGKIFASFGNFTWAPAVVNPLLSQYAETLGWPVVAQAKTKQSATAETFEEICKLADAVVKAMKEKEEGC